MGCNQFKFKAIALPSAEALAAALNNLFEDNWQLTPGTLNVSQGFAVVHQPVPQPMDERTAQGYVQTRSNR